MFGNIYQNRKVFLTGHTGFKGSWLTLWLKKLGSDITGLALPPDTEPNHWDLLGLDIPEYHIDIRNADALTKTINSAKPEIIFHLAAQSLVRRSYREPQATWDTNVMGTVNVLEACRQSESVKAIVIVTTDKCYENKENPEGYSENDRLGGHDPYSASKAATELLASSYRDAFFKPSNGPLVATARAGNVIGGGDWAEDRLVPDLVRSHQKNETLMIRSPNAVRPWQHVLEPLTGYLQLGAKLLEGNRDFEGAWNFGPDKSENLTVSEFLNSACEKWPDLHWKVVPDHHKMHETGILRLNSTKARQLLNWRPILSVDRQLEWTVEWYKAYLKDQAVISRAQLDEYREILTA